MHSEAEWTKSLRCLWRALKFGSQTNNSRHRIHIKTCLEFVEKALDYQVCITEKRRLLFDSLQLRKAFLCYYLDFI